MGLFMKNGKIYLLIVIYFFISCKKEDKEIIPAIPPVSTMSVDFSFLSANKSGLIELTNWQYASVSLAVWNSLLKHNCAVPIVSFEKAVEQKAVYIDNNTWEWSNTFNADSVNIKARLTGKQASDSVDWKLYISTIKLNKSSGDYLWIEGKSATDQTGGWWVIYENPSSPNPFIKIVWSKNSEESLNRFTLIKPADPDYGQYLEYKTGEGLYNSRYMIKLHNDNSVNIELNTASKEGRIKSVFLFNNLLWHCWDASLSNINCN